MNDTRKEKQQVSLRTVTRRTLVIFLPMVILLSGILVTFYYANTRSEREIIESTEPKVVELELETIAHNFQSIVSDVIILSQHEELKNILDGDKEAKDKLANEFFAFSKGKRYYDQVRYLDETGMEVIRINFNDGKPSRVPYDKLQSKGNRYYFTESSALNKDDVFISPLDLNIEQEVIERPLKENIHPNEATFDSIWREAKGGKYVKPIMRFATPIFNSTGKKKGIVLVNYLGAHLLNVFNEMGRNFLGQCFLVNGDGFWLKGPSSETEWGFMREHDKEQRFENTFSDAWPKISKQESGQFYTGEGLFTFATIYPLLEGLKTSTGSGEAFQASVNRLKTSEYSWKVVSHVPPGILYAKRNALAGWLLITWGLLTIILGGCCWSLAWNAVAKQHAKNALQKSRDKYKSLVSKIPGITYRCALDKDWTMLYISEEVNKISGYPASDFINNSVRTYESIIHREDTEYVERAVNKAVESSDPWEIEYRIHHKDGSIRWIYEKGRGVIGKNSNVEFLDGFILEVTKRKKAEKERENLAKFPSENPNPVLRVSKGTAHK